MGRCFTIALAAALCVVSGRQARAQGAEPVQPPSELKKLSLEQLFDMEVTSVSKKPEKLSETAAAVHVVTDEDIRRSGALSIPEALRDVPGVEVARLDASRYAITARGFNGTVANKLLVLMDGRSLYTPLYSGVFWDVQDTFMEDIGRIEVIRGPGATVWGANAVNGVINVITKSTEETQGLLITGGGGNEEHAFGGVRYGGRLGSNAFFRVYGKSFDRDAQVLPDGHDATNSFRMSQGGFRIDWEPATDNEVAIQGDIYSGRVLQDGGDDTDLAGGNVLGRWTHQLGERSNVQVQAYFDRTERDIPATFSEKLNTYDFDFQHRFPLGSRQDVVWGLGYRLTRDEVGNNAFLAFLPPELTNRLYTGFIQDEFSLAPDRLRLEIGSKFEHNDYTGFEYQPSIRLAWTPAAEHTLWASVSRVVRDPSRIDRDLFIPAEPPFLLAGGPDFVAEALRAHELGYKARPTSVLTLSLATFYNVYHRLRSVEMNPPPAVLANGLKGRTYGAELEGTYQALTWWMLNAGATLLHMDLRAEPDSTDTTQAAQEGDSPRHQFFARSLMDLPHGLEIDVTVRRVDELPHQMVPAYTAYDLRLGWKPTPSFELSVAGQNLSDSRHPEFGTPATRQEIQRSYYMKATCRF